MRRLRRTKIVATLGPASSDQSAIASLFQAGADVFRINMSHTSHERMRELVAAIRAVESEHGRPIGILVDLQGPKLRVGSFTANPAALTKGATFTLDADPSPGDASRVHLPHPEIFAAIEPGHTLLLDDGKVRLVATEVSGDRILTRVEVGGKLSDRKGVSLPDSMVPFSALAEKDRSDLEAALDAGIDWVALSFIQRPEDIAEAKKITRGRAAVMAKIEKPQAVHRLGEIIEISDSLMVARGDLGVEMPLEKVPGVQKQMTRSARHAGKPVVVATQMLESMITSPVPTRAEVSDVSTAIFEGADAIMLSAEFGGRAIPGGGGRHHEPHRRGGRTRPDLSHHHSSPAHRPGGNRCRRHRRGRASDRGDARAFRHHLLDELGLDCAARCARAAEIADRGDLPQAFDRAASVADLGRALHRGGGRTRSRRHGGTRMPARLQGRIHQSRPARHHRRRRAAGNARRHQHAADRVRGAERGGLRADDGEQIRK